MICVLITTFILAFLSFCLGVGIRNRQALMIDYSHREDVYNFEKAKSEIEEYKYYQKLNLLSLILLFGIAVML